MESEMPLACRTAGHRFRFTSEGRVMAWKCQRGCGTGGTKTYGSAADAARYATAFDLEDSEGLGRRAPLLGMFPLRMAYKLRQRSRRPAP